MTDAAEHGREWVAIILAVGFVSAMNIITFAVLYDAIRSSGPGLSENATQILTTGFGAMGGLLGAFLGARAVAAGTKVGSAQATRDPRPDEDSL